MINDDWSCWLEFSPVVVCKIDERFTQREGALQNARLDNLRASQRPRVTWVALPVESQSSLSRVSVEWFLECKTLPSISQHPAASCCEAVSLLPTGCKEVLDIGQWALGSQRKQPLCQTLQNTVKQCSFKAAIYHNYITIIEGSLEVKLPTIWTDGKAEVGRVREERSRREKIREEKESEERRCRCAKR